MNRLSLSLLLLFPATLLAGTEYNEWYRDNTGTLSVITQTEKNDPVFVSIAAGGTSGASVVITLMQACNEQQVSALLWVNNVQQKVRFHCVHVNNMSLTSYIIDDASRVNVIYSSLKSGFTVVLDKRIKIWAANINTPDSAG